MNYLRLIKNIVVASGGDEWIPAFVNKVGDYFAKESDKRLVVIQLSGGNDGLNTIIPYQNDFYYKARPNISISKNSLIKITDELGFHNGLADLRHLYDNGELAIINGVGYPSPIRSHFRSKDIWESGSDTKQYWNTGWIGRYLDEQTKKKGYRHTAIEADDTLSLALKGLNYKGLAIKDAKKFYRNAQEPIIQEVLQNHRQIHTHNHGAQYLYKTLIDTVSSAGYIYEKNKIKRSKQTYPRTQLGKQLKTIANFISSGIDTQVYYASAAGYDTHAKQKVVQNKLLTKYSSAITSFVEDLKRNSAFENTLILTFSEFGRRVTENGTKGTDHGTANNLFVIGSNIKRPGFYNSLPSLSDLDKNGDLKFEIDFRQVYATILNKWLDADDEKILKEKYQYLDFL